MFALVVYGQPEKGESLRVLLRYNRSMREPRLEGEQ
jgi:hypothetical protein